MTVAEIITEAMKLTVEERQQLLWAVEESLDDDLDDAPLVAHERDEKDDVFMAEIRRRVRSALAGDPGIDFETVEREMLEELQRP